MAINVDCDRCLKPINEFGALAFSPPDGNSRCEKLHLCKSCWESLVDWIFDFEGRRAAIVAAALRN